eukprot:662137-Rhodomonas_salina.2
MDAARRKEEVANRKKAEEVRTCWQSATPDFSFEPWHAHDEILHSKGRTHWFARGFRITIQT